MPEKLGGQSLNGIRVISVFALPGSRSKPETGNENVSSVPEPPRQNRKMGTYKKVSRSQITDPTQNQARKQCSPINSALYEQVYQSVQSAKVPQHHGCTS